MALGYLALVLHAHLPFVRHPESDFVLEEEWLFEAITETYVPLLQVFENLKRDGVDFKMTMSMTPPLVSMLRDELLQDRYDAHLTQMEELIGKEIERNQHNGHLRYLAEYYANSFSQIRKTWESYDRDLIVAFKQFLEFIRSCFCVHCYCLHRFRIQWFVDWLFTTIVCGRTMGINIHSQSQWCCKR